MIITTPMPTHDTQSLATPTCIHTTHGIHLLVPNYMDLTSLLLLDAGYRYGLFLCYGLFSVALSFLSDTRCLVVGGLRTTRGGQFGLQNMSATYE